VWAMFGKRGGDSAEVSPRDLPSKEGVGGTMKKVSLELACLKKEF